MYGVRTKNIRKRSLDEKKTLIGESFNKGGVVTDGP